MKKVLLTLCVSGAAAMMAGAALAQYDVASQREADIRARINDGVSSGDLRYDQARQLRGELRQIEQLDARYTDEGMTGWDRRDLNSRLSLLDSRLDYDLNMNRGDDDGY